MAVNVATLGLSCHDCKNNEDLKRHRGCYAKTEHPQYVIDGEKIYRCPSKYIWPQVREYIQLYHYFKKGHLPFRGSIMEQPVKLLEIFDTIESVQNELSKEK